MMKRVLMLLIIGALLVSGCECVGGLGRDMQKAGEWVEKKAEENK